MLELTINSQASLNYAQLDIVFSSVANLVNQRPFAVRNYTEEDYHVICPNDLLLQRTKNSVQGAVYGDNDNLTKRQQVMHELETTWWNMWVRQALPHLVPFKRWKVEYRSVRVGDIVMVLEEK